MRVPPEALRLVAISGEPERVDELVEWALAAERGGATCVQLRAKRVPSGALVEMTQALVRELRVPVIVNDRADVAIAGGAAGVHLGADDLPVHAVRAFAADHLIIGASAGSESELANARDADYVGVGPVFGTASKDDAGPALGVAEMARLIAAAGLPAVGIGGITAGNAREVIDAGASGVAVLSALSADVEYAARELAGAIGK